MLGSIPAVTMPPPGTPPEIFLLDVLFPTPGHTKRDNSPLPGLAKNLEKFRFASTKLDAIV